MADPSLLVMHLAFVIDHGGGWCEDCAMCEQARLMSEAVSVTLIEGKPS